MTRNKLALLSLAPVALGAMWLAGCSQQSATNTDVPNGASANTAGAAGEATAPTTKLKLERGGGWTSGGIMREQWTLKITDAKTGQPVKDFDVVHDQLMHLIVVSKDLRLFNHLHPQYKGNGVFTVATKLPGPGQGGYKVFADYTPKGGTNEVQQQEVEGTGSASLTADKLSSGWIVKRVVAGTEDQLIATPQKQLKADAGPLAMNNGPRYQVALMPMPAKFVAGQEAMLHFQVRDANGKPLKDLQPYLGGLGHCVVISSDTKTYLHTHPMENDTQSSGPDVMFHTTFPKAGLYKVWGQFKHRDKIITAAYVVNVDEAPGGTTPEGATQGSAHEGHEAH